MATDRVDGIAGLAGIAVLCGVALSGVVVGACAGWVSRGAWRVGGDHTTVLPWGLALSLLGSMSYVTLARALRRQAALLAAVSWFVGVVVLLVRGDTVVAGDTLGVVFLVVVTGAVVLTASLGSVRR